MDDIYLGIYSTLYSLQGRDRDGLLGGPVPNVYVPGSNRFDSDVRRAIDDAVDRMQRQTEVRVRPDAKYFLRLNLVNMIAVPILISQQAPPGFVLEAAIHDVDLILREAGEQSEPGRPSIREISAHGIIDALSRNWRNLRLSEVRIWDGGSAR